MDRRALERALEARDLDALLCLSTSSREAEMAVFCGVARLGECVVLAARDAPPALGYFSAMERDEASRAPIEAIGPRDLSTETLMPGSVETWCAGIAALCARRPVSPRRIGLAGHLPAGLLTSIVAKLRRRGLSVHDGSSVVSALRRRKTGADLESMEDAAAASSRVFCEVAAMLAGAQVKDGELWWDGGRLTVGGLRQRIAVLFATERLSEPDGNLIAPAEEGAVPHSTGSDDRVLRAGESIVVDLFPKGRFFSDCTRTFCVGEPRPALREAHGLVEECLRRASREIAPGVRGFSLQRQVCERFAQDGHATPLDDTPPVEGYVHGLGHGVGFEVHEMPHFRDLPGEDGVLREGDVVTLEPGLYSPSGGWAVRLEDLLAVTRDGARNLTELPYELDPRAFPGTLG